MTEKFMLITMRLADMVRVHPDQVMMHCADCGHEVGVYPSGQEVLRQHADTKIVCQRCHYPPDGTQLAPGAEFEPAQSVRRKS